MKKLPIPFFSKNPEEEEEDDEDDDHIDTTTASPSLWPWPYYCRRPRTLSFRSAADDTGHFFRTINTVYSVDGRDDDLDTEPGTNVPEDDDESSVVEMAVRGLRSSERLFFEPGETSSILEESKRDCELPLIKESLVMSMESRDPYVDFRKSMEEMVRAYGIKEWDGLKGLLDWYLRVNGKANHGHILGAFVDLLVDVQAREAISYRPSSSPSTAHFCHHHRQDYNSSPTCSSSPLSLCTSASSCSSSNSLSTPSVSMFEAEGRRSSGGGSSSDVPCLSIGVADEFQIR